MLEATCTHNRHIELLRSAKLLLAFSYLLLSTLLLAIARHMAKLSTGVAESVLLTLLYLGV